MNKGGEKHKKEIVIADTSNFKVKMTFWGELCDHKCLKVGQIFAVRNALIKEFKGAKSLTFGFKSDLVLNFDDTELQVMKQFKKKFDENK